MPKQAKILIVDDSVSNLDLLQEILQQDNYHITLADGGQKAIVLAKQTMPDLILLDVMMPHVDGFDVCRHLKYHSETRSIPIIFITAKTDRDSIIKGFDEGAVDYVTKPFFPTELMARIKLHLELKFYKDLLEEKVTERTKELLDTNEKLKKEIIDREAAEKKVREREIQVKSIQMGIASKVGEMFFDTIILKLASTLKANYTFVGELYGDDFQRVRTIAFCKNGRIEPNFEYSIIQTPCEKVINQGAFGLAHGIQSLFNNDLIIKDLNIEGYVGVSLFNSKHQPIGVMVAMFNVALNDVEFTKSVLKIFSTRVGAEMERRKTERILEQYRNDLENIVKQRTDQLITSEQKYKALFNEMLSGYALYEVIVDENKNPVDYIFLEVNPAFEKLTGLNRENILNRKVSQINIPTNNINWLSKYNEVITTGKPYRFESFSQLIDRYFEVTVYSPRENVFATIFTDITERKNAEQQILTAIIETEEKEKGRIAQELHDGLGPILSTIKLFVQSLSESEDISHIKIVSNKTSKALDEAIQSLTEISNNLSPHILHNFGLNSAIRSFIEKIKDSSAVSYTFNSEITQRLKSDIEITFYRIIVELINNSIKHSKAKNVNIFIKKLENNLMIEYSDNGQGFDVDKILKESKGMGIYNIFNRIKKLDGNLVIESELGKGLKVIVTYPYSEKNN